MPENLKLKPEKTKAFDAQIEAKKEIECLPSTKRYQCKKLLEASGIKVLSKDENGLMTISNYARKENVDFSKFGIKNEEELFKFIKEAKGDVNLAGSEMTSLGSLEKVGGNFDLTGSKIELGTKELYIDGNLDLQNANFCWFSQTSGGSILNVSDNVHGHFGLSITYFQFWGKCLKIKHNRANSKNRSITYFQFVLFSLRLDSGPPIG